MDTDEATCDPSHPTPTDHRRIWRSPPTSDHRVDQRALRDRL